MEWPCHLPRSLNPKDYLHTCTWDARGKKKERLPDDYVAADSGEGKPMGKNWSSIQVMEKWAGRCRRITLLHYRPPRVMDRASEAEQVITCI